MQDFPKVGIIYLTFPTKNWEADINRCLSSLEKINYPKDALELICVESKGDLPSVKPWLDMTWRLKSGKELPRITYVLKEERIGFAGNNNLGLDKAREMGCDYVLLINEDAEADPDCILRAVERAESDPKVAVVQSLILMGDSRDKVNTVGNAFHYLGFGYSNGYLWTRRQADEHFANTRTSNPDLEIGYASGAGMLVKLSALGDDPLFDDKFFSYHEDTDVCFKLRMRGFKIVVEPSSVIWHYYEFAKSKVNYFFMERNRYVLVLSYYKLKTLLLLAPAFLYMDAAATAFSIRNRWFLMKLKVYRDLLSPSFWSWIFKRRKAVRNNRLISDRKFLRYAVPDILFQDVRNPLLTYIGNPILRLYWRIVCLLVRW